VKIQHPVALFVSRVDAAVAAAVEARERAGQPVALIDLSSEPLLSAPIALATALRTLKRPGSVARLLLPPRLVRRIPQLIHLAQTLSRRGIQQIEAFDDRARAIAAAVTSLLDPTALDDSMLDIDWTSLEAEAIGVRWMTVRLDAAVAEVDVHTASQRLAAVVKQHRLEPRIERARHEAAALMRLPDVPRVLLFDEARATIVMERAAGTSLDRLFATAGESELIAATERAGAWLRAMQTATRSSASAHAALHDTVAGAVRDANATMGPRAAAVIARLQALESRFVGDTVVGHHGDYWPGNIFIDDERVTVIDLEGFREGLPLEDVAYFLMRADMLCRRYRLRVMPRLRDAFLRGYGETPPRDALQLFALTKGLRTLANNTGGNLPLPMRIWTQRIVRNSVLQALR
jgi:hypothetical protein